MRVGKNKSEIATGLPPHHRAFVSTPSRHANVIAVCPTPDRAYGPRKTSWSAYRSVHIQRKAFYRELYAVAWLLGFGVKGCTKRPTDHTIFTEPDCYEPLPSQSECPLSGVKRTSTENKKIVLYRRREAASIAALHCAEAEFLAAVRHVIILPLPATRPWQRRRASSSHVRTRLSANAAQLLEKVFVDPLAQASSS